jgi:hypothetical protein
LQVFLVRVDLLQEINLADLLLQVTQARYFVSNTTVKTTPEGTLTHSTSFPTPH